MSVKQPSLRRRSRKQKSWTWIDKGALWDQYDVDVQDTQKHKGVLGSWRHVRHDASVLLQMVQKRPLIVVLPACVFLSLLAVGIWGTVGAADKDTEDAKKEALRATQNVAMKFAHLLKEASFSATAVGIIVQTYPQYSFVSKQYSRIAKDVLANKAGAGVVQRLDLAPFGTVSHVFPVYNAGYGMGYNFIQSPKYNLAITNALSSANITIVGPVQIGQGPLVALATYPIFVTNVTKSEKFGIPLPEPTSCSVCYVNSTQSKFWGLSIAVIDWAQLLAESGFPALSTSGYNYKLERNALQLGEAATVVASTPRAPVNPLVLDVDGTSGLWSIEVSLASGWGRGWEAPLLAGVVIIVTIFSVMLFSWIVAMQKYKHLLRAILPAQVIKKLRRGQTFLQKHSSVTILFSDIVSYTSMAAEMDPVNVVQLLDEVYSMYDRLIEKHRVFKVDVIGDSFMAMAGCPDDEDPVRAAVKVAWLAESMLQSTRDLVTKSGYRIRIRIGIHSGPVVAAVLGTKSPRFSVFGDTVNVASRMESAGAPMRVQISEQTADLLRLSGEQFTLLPRGEVAIKGKGYMTTFWLEPPQWEAESTPSPTTSRPATPCPPAEPHSTGGSRPCSPAMLADSDDECPHHQSNDHRDSADDTHHPLHHHHHARDSARTSVRNNALYLGELGNGMDSPRSRLSLLSPWHSTAAAPAVDNPLHGGGGGGNHWNVDVEGFGASRPPPPWELLGNSPGGGGGQRMSFWEAARSIGSSSRWEIPSSCGGRGDVPPPPPDSGVGRYSDVFSSAASRQLPPPVEEASGGLRYMGLQPPHDEAGGLRYSAVLAGKQVHDGPPMRVYRRTVSGDMASGARYSVSSSVVSAGEVPPALSAAEILRLTARHSSSGGELKPPLPPAMHAMYGGGATLQPGAGKFPGEGVRLLEDSIPAFRGGGGGATARFLGEGVRPLEDSIPAYRGPGGGRGPSRGGVDLQLLAELAAVRQGASLRGMHTQRPPTAPASRSSAQWFMSWGSQGMPAEDHHPLPTDARHSRYPGSGGGVSSVPASRPASASARNGNNAQWFMSWGPGAEDLTRPGSAKHSRYPGSGGLSVSAVPSTASSMSLGPGGEDLTRPGSAKHSRYPGSGGPAVSAGAQRARPSSARGRSQGTLTHEPSPPQHAKHMRHSSSGAPGLPDTPPFMPWTSRDMPAGDLQSIIPPRGGPLAVPSATPDPPGMPPRTSASLPPSTPPQPSSLVSPSHTPKWWGLPSYWPPTDAKGPPSTGSGSSRTDAQGASRAASQGGLDSEGSMVQMQRMGTVTEAKAAEQGVVGAKPRQVLKVEVADKSWDPPLVDVIA